MRVFINGRFLTQDVTGVQRFCLGVIEALDRLLCEPRYRNWKFEVVAPRGIQHCPPLRHILVRSTPLAGGHLWEQLVLPEFARGGVLLSLGNTGPLRVRNQCVVIHDASVFAVPGSYSAAFRSWYRFLLPQLGKRVRLVLTVSEFSRKELVHRLRLPSHRIAVIPEGCDHILVSPPDTAILDSHGLRDCRFLLTVGSSAPHKNHSTLLRAMGFLPRREFRLVVTGPANPRVFAAQSAATNSPLVTHVGYVTDAQLRALYEHATAFVFPSLYEGFGLPVLEAMACGCPVAASRLEPLREVGGDAVMYFDPRDPSDIAKSVALILASPEMRAHMRQKALERAKEFSWERAAGTLLRALEKAYQR